MENLVNQKTVSNIRNSWYVFAIPVIVLKPVKK